MHVGYRCMIDLDLHMHSNDTMMILHGTSCSTSSSSPQTISWSELECTKVHTATQLCQLLYMHDFIVIAIPCSNTDLIDLGCSVAIQISIYYYSYALSSYEFFVLDSCKSSQLDQSCQLIYCPSLILQLQLIQLVKLYPANYQVLK